MISFDVDSVETAQRVLEKVRVITFAESLGGTESLITYPMKQTHPDVPKEWREKLGITDTLLRLSVGLEHVDELIADLEQAFVSLEKIHAVGTVLRRSRKMSCLRSVAGIRILQGRIFVEREIRNDNL